MLHTRECVLPDFQTPRREFKERRLVAIEELIFYQLVVTRANTLIIHQGKSKKITTVEVWIPGLYLYGFLLFYFSVYSSIFVSIVKIHQKLEIVFHRLSKHLEFRQKYSAARRIFNSLLDVSITR